MNSNEDTLSELDKVSTNADLNLDENTPLLSKYGHTSWSSLKCRYRNTRKCISSKGALAILMWSFVVSTLHYLFLNPAAYLSLEYIQNASITFIIVYGTTATIFRFYPIAGNLADNKYGRYKTVVFSLWLYS